MVTQMDALSGGSSRAPAAVGTGGEAGVSAATRRELGRRDQPGVPGTLENRTAAERGGQRGRLYAEHVAEAAALFRLRGSGVIEQPGGEIDAWRGAGAQELVACGKRQAGTERSGDSLRDLVLPSAGRLVKRLLDGGPARDWTAGNCPRSLR